MSLQVLVAAMNEDAAVLCEKMNLSTPAILVNQCDRYAYEEITYRGKEIRCFHMKERGVGLSRNTALLRATAEICLFSDEDIVLSDDYEAKILKAFAENTRADVIVFNVDVDERRATYKNTKKKRVSLLNFGRYPTYAVAAKTERLREKRITFSLLFGGGAPYSCGEDSQFLRDCLKNKLRIYAHTDVIGREAYRESTWFHGYDRKFFYDRGVLLKSLYGTAGYLWVIRFVLTKRKQFPEIPMKQAYQYMMEGFHKLTVK